MDIEVLKRALQDKRVLAFLMMIRKCEGTAAADGYRYLFGSSPHNDLRFIDMSRHPNIKRPFGERWSTAAGAYQILHSTDDRLTKLLGLVDFSPRSQDLKCCGLLAEAGILQAVMDGRFEFAVSKANKIWASLPGSPYGQPVHTLEVATGCYEAALACA